MCRFMRWNRSLPYLLYICVPQNVGVQIVRYIVYDRPRSMPRVHITVTLKLHLHFCSSTHATKTNQFGEHAFGTRHETQSFSSEFGKYAVCYLPKVRVAVHQYLEIRRERLLKKCEPGHIHTRSILHCLRHPLGEVCLT